MTIDKAAMRELSLYIENEGRLYNQTKSIVANLDKKVRAGKYDGRLAPKLWLYLVDAGAVMYVQTVEGKRRADDARVARQHFPTELRRALAEEMAREYEKEARTRGLTIDDDRHLCHSCAQHEVKDMKEEGQHLRSEAHASFKGKRAQLHPGTDWWMRGARYGEVVGVTGNLYKIKLDATGKVVKVKPTDVYQFFDK